MGAPFLAPSNRVSLTQDELLVQFRGLLAAYRAVREPLFPGDNNLRCDQCLLCHRCRFCSQCRRCDDCSNCEDCEDCIRCTRSRSTRHSRDCNYVEHCDGCEDSQYLVLCLDCSRCEQCFACVGLEGESYCILNQRYTRKTYFQVLQALRRQVDELGPSLLQALEDARLGRGVLPGVDAGGKFRAIDGIVQAVLEGDRLVQAEDDPWLPGVVPRRYEASTDRVEAASE